MKIKRKEMCGCEENKGSFSKLSDFYCENFAPSDWKLDYESLTEFEEERSVNLIEICKACGKLRCAGKGMGYNRSGLELIGIIWADFLNYRPYGYVGVPARVKWYKKQDNMSIEEKLDIFIDLFDEKDKQLVNEWLDLNRDKIIETDLMKKEAAINTDLEHKDRRKLVNYINDIEKILEELKNMTPEENQKDKLQEIVKLTITYDMSSH